MLRIGRSPLAGVPPRTECGVVLSKLQAWIGIDNRPNVLSGLRYDSTQFCSSLLAQFDSASFQRSYGVVRIDISVAALQEKAEWISGNGLLDRLLCHGWEIGGIEPAVGTKNDGMTSVVK